jgi:hypothetical protein
VGLKQRAAVAPEVIRLAIERALSAEPPFTGTAGAADVTPEPASRGQGSGPSSHRFLAGNSFLETLQHAPGTCWGGDVGTTSLPLERASTGESASKPTVAAD